MIHLEIGNFSIVAILNWKMEKNPPGTHLNHFFGVTLSTYPLYISEKKLEHKIINYVQKEGIKNSAKIHSAIQSTEIFLKCVWTRRCGVFV